MGKTVAGCERASDCGLRCLGTCLINLKYQNRRADYLKAWWERGQLGGSGQALTIPQRNKHPELRLSHGGACFGNCYFTGMNPVPT